MKAIAIEAYGGPEQLKLTELPTPVPGDNEVLIEIACTSVNPVDWKVCRGDLRERIPNQFPIIPGWDAAGTIKAVGKNVTAWKGGERVFAYCRKPVIQWGTYCEYVAVDASVVAPMPHNISFAQAAAIPLTGLTAWQSLFDCALLTTDQTILIHAAAGGVGGFGVQLARHIGATIYATASPNHHDYVRKLGAHHVIDYKSGDFVAAVKRLVPGGVDHVFDTVGGEVYRRSFEALKPGGHIVSIREKPNAPLDAQYGVRSGYVFVNPDGAELTAIADLFEEGDIQPPAIEELPLAEAARAFERSMAGHVAGKLVLRVR